MRCCHRCPRCSADLAAYRTVESWNRRYPSGTDVLVDGFPARTLTEAQVWRDDDAVVWLEGWAGPTRLARIVPARRRARLRGLLRRRPA